MNEAYFTGLDLGQSQDFTALAVVERTELKGRWDAGVWAYRKTAALRLRHIERMPLGTPYPEVVERAVAVMRSEALAGRRHLAADATGVGRPVVDMLQRAEPPCEVWPVMINGADVERYSDGFYRVPKRDLIVRLQVMLQSGELEIAAAMEAAPALVREMMEMRVKVTQAGREQYAVFREGEHDDLVLAVALACWTAKKVYPDPQPGEVVYWTRAGEQRVKWK